MVQSARSFRRSVSIAMLPQKIGAHPVSDVARPSSRSREETRPQTACTEHSKPCPRSNREKPPTSAGPEYIAKEIRRQNPAQGQRRFPVGRPAPIAHTILDRLPLRKASSG